MLCVENYLAITGRSGVLGGGYDLCLPVILVVISLLETTSSALISIRFTCTLTRGYTLLWSSSIWSYTLFTAMNRRD